MAKTAQKYKQMEVGLARNLALFIQARAASDLVAMVKLRVSGTGEDSRGRQMHYKEGPYKRWRAKKYQVAYKDFMITGQMWRGIDVIGVKHKGTVVEITYGPKTDYSRTLLQGHNEREKTNIIKPNKEEISELKQLVVGFIKDYIKKNGR